MWRSANSLIILRDQINSVCPGRNKASDGTIGDAAHAASVSDHNPNGAGVVTALDLTHDPAHGFDIADFSEMLRINQDARIKYVIANRRIFIAPNYNWVNYTGSNPHTSHVHISVSADSNLYDNGNNWRLTTQQEEEMISDADNEYGRWERLGWQIRGRHLSRDEFRASAVGGTWLNAMEILSDDQEANNTQGLQELGALATKDGWANQIYGLQKQLIDRDVTIEALKTQLSNTQTTMTAAVTTAQKTAPVATKAPWYIKLLAALAGKK